MAAVVERGVERYHPMREVVDMFRYDVPALGGSAVKGFFSLFTHGNMPEQPLAQHGEHDDMYLRVHPEVERVDQNS